MGINVLNVRGFQMRIVQGLLHSPNRAFTGGGRLGNMVRIGGKAHTRHFRVNFSTAGFGVFQFFQNDNAAAFA